MDNGDILALDIVHHDLADGRLGEQVAVPEEEQVAALKGGLHAAGQDDDDW